MAPRLSPTTRVTWLGCSLPPVWSCSSVGLGLTLGPSHSPLGAHANPSRPGPGLQMTPGLGFFYSGLLRRKNALSMIFLSLAIYAVVSFQWFFWGYSLAFAPDASSFIGTLTNFGFMDVDLQPSVGSPKIPALGYAVYQMMFATITPMIVLGAVAERGRIAPTLVFTIIWSTLVYDPIACWTWNPKGWTAVMGTLDFAGGGPVHMSSGTAALAYSIWLGKRRGYGTEKLAYRPHNVAHVVLGTALLWFGWFGFNGGSALAANLRAFQACMVTNTAAAVGGLTWLVLDYFQERKWSPVGFCSGAIAGLVGITPASGYVGTPASVAIGMITAIACNYATKLKILIGCDDALDIFASHGVGGFVGSLLTALFADKRVASFDGTTAIAGGWINHHYVQLGYQLASSLAIMAYTFVVTFVILVALNYVPGLGLRASPEAEIVGIDEHELGECAYDYAFLERDIENVDYHDELLKVSGEPGGRGAAAVVEASTVHTKRSSPGETTSGERSQGVVEIVPGKEDEAVGRK